MYKKLGSIAWIASIVALHPVHADSLSRYNAEQFARGRAALDASQARYQQWFASLSPREQDLESDLQQLFARNAQDGREGYIPVSRESVAQVLDILGVQSRDDALFVIRRMQTQERYATKMNDFFDAYDQSLRQSDDSLCGVGLTQFCRR
jgi:hypothetical protein